MGAERSARLPANVHAVAARSFLPTNIGWSFDGLPRAARRTGFDVFHAPAYTAPQWGVHPLVVTIHDVSYERHPEWYPYHIDPLRRWFYRRSARVADAIITDSSFSRSEIAAAYGIPLERIHVVPLGVSTPFTTHQDEPAGARRPIMANLEQATPSTRAGSVADEGAPRIVHVGDLHARRNLLVLVEALAALRERSGPTSTTELLLIGVDRGAAAAIRERAQTLGVIGSVTFMPNADDETVVRELRRAAVLAYPSRYEGFGLPVLEAMACGTPVVASTAASLPEVVGGAGILVDPSDVRGWVDAIAAVIESPGRANHLSDAGRQRAATFTWTRTAVKTAEVYERAVRRRVNSEI